jgi:hypothetical protein
MSPAQPARRPRPRRGEFSFGRNACGESCAIVRVKRPGRERPSDIVSTRIYVAKYAHKSAHHAHGTVMLCKT